MNNSLKRISIFFNAALLASCSLAPCYHRPAMPIPTHYKEVGKWIPANSHQITLPPTNWWVMFHDSELNTLENQVKYNQNLKIAFERYQEACALAAQARANLYPTINGAANAARQQTSSNVANKNTQSPYSDLLVGAALTYEIDVWGRVRNLVRASELRAKASVSDLAAVQLSLQAELASDYFSLRGDDAAERIVDNMVAVYKRALGLVRNRHQGGIAPELDVDQAKTQYESAKTLASDIRLRRAKLEHAIAVLIGQTPETFNLTSMPLNAPPLIVVSPSLPSTLLERRPDIAAAEERVAAANADIGVARAAFYPSFHLLSAAGVESSTLQELFQMPSVFWAIGSAGASGLFQPAVSYVLFDGGRIRAQLMQANASYYETVAMYRQTILNAYQEVEDSLTALRRLNEEDQSQTLAAAAANRALFQIQREYYGGIITYLDVVVIQNTALNSQLTLVDIQTQRQLASIQLIRALGGGWQMERKL